MPCSFLLLLFVLGMLLPGRLAASIEYDAQIPQLAFAAQELTDALKEAGRENLHVALIVKPDETSPEAFQIRCVGPKRVEVTSMDTTGAMYGGLEVADLRVEVEATDGNGVPEVRLRLNGLVLNAEKKTGNLFAWSGSSEDLLKSLGTGMYHLEAVAVDKNGLRTSGEIYIKVGNASQSRRGDWKDKIHQVILNEGETFSNADTRNFPQLECFLNLADDGSLALNSGRPGNSEGRIWGTNGKANRHKSHPVRFRFYAVLDDGQLQIHREKPGRPKVIIYETRSVSGPGPFKLGITASKSLVIFRKAGKKTEIIWRSPVQD